MTELEKQLLAVMRECDEAMAYMSEYDIPLTLPDRVKEAISAAEAAANSTAPAAVPDEMQYSVVSKGERIPDSYVEGWNDCRNAMLAAQVDQSGIKTMLKPGTQEYGSAINAAANMADQCFVFHKDKFKWLCKFEQSFRSLNAPTAKPQVKAADAS